MATLTPRRRYATRLPREERREQVLDATLRVIARDSWSAATMERVAAEADIAKSVVYSQFGSRAGLLDALMRREQERAFAITAAAVFSAPAEPDPALAVRRALMTYLEGVAAYPDTWRIVLMPSHGTPPLVRAAIEEGRERWRRELEPIATQLLAGLGIESLDTELVTHLARAHAEYLARLILEQPDRFTPDRIAAFTQDVAAELPQEVHMTPDHEIAIIGAGLSGIGMGIALRDAGIEDFVLLERAGDIGGTWRDNTYPGIAVDIPAQAYQFSYDVNPDWSRVFARGPEVKAYVDGVADRHGIRPHVRLNSEVVERTWDEDDQLWRLRIGAGGEVTARFVVSAIGAFVDPKPVDIPGVDDFGGKVLHSARWDHGYDLAGKRVAIVGTGASAVQIIPEIARVVAHLDVYQRTPIWIAPKPDYRTPEAVKALYRRVPPVQKVVRFVNTVGMEVLLVSMVLHHQRIPFAVRGAQAWLRNVWYRSQVPDPELRAKLTPDYGLGCKRPAVSNSYLRTFTKDHVDLVTTPIERITPGGVRTTDGVEHPIDALVLATGFRLSVDPENYRRKPVRGRDGFDLATAYERERLRSYESISLPKLPNHFMIFGPYGWTGGTWHTLVETASAHIVRVIGEARRRGAAEVEVREEATERWTAKTRERFNRSLWATDSCATANSYYYDQHGDTSYLRPTSALEAHYSSRHFPLDDYVFTPPRVRERLPEQAAAA